MEKWKRYRPRNHPKNKTKRHQLTYSNQCYNLSIRSSQKIRKTSPKEAIGVPLTKSCSSSSLQRRKNKFYLTVKFRIQSVAVEDLKRKVWFKVMTDEIEKLHIYRRRVAEDETSYEGHFRQGMENHLGVSSRKQYLASLNQLMAVCSQTGPIPKTSSNSMKSIGQKKIRFQI